MRRERRPWRKLYANPPKTQAGLTYDGQGLYDVLTLIVEDDGSLCTGARPIDDAALIIGIKPRERPVFAESINELRDRRLLLDESADGGHAYRLADFAAAQARPSKTTAGWREWARTWGNRPFARIRRDEPSFEEMAYSERVCALALLRRATALDDDGDGILNFTSVADLAFRLRCATRAQARRCASSIDRLVEVGWLARPVTTRLQILDFQRFAIGDERQDDRVTAEMQPDVDRDVTEMRPDNDRVTAEMQPDVDHRERVNIAESLEAACQYGSGSGLGHGHGQEREARMADQGQPAPPENGSPMAPEPVADGGIAAEVAEAEAPVPAPVPTQLILTPDDPPPASSKRVNGEYTEAFGAAWQAYKTASKRDRDKKPAFRWWMKRAKEIPGGEERLRDIVLADIPHLTREWGSGIGRDGQKCTPYFSTYLSEERYQALLDREAEAAAKAAAAKAAASDPARIEAAKQRREDERKRAELEAQDQLLFVFRLLTDTALDPIADRRTITRNHETALPELPTETERRREAHRLVRAYIAWFEARHPSAQERVTNKPRWLGEYEALEAAAKKPVPEFPAAPAPADPPPLVAEPPPERLAPITPLPVRPPPIAPDEPDVDRAPMVAMAHATSRRAPARVGAAHREMPAAAAAGAPPFSRAADFLRHLAEEKSAEATWGDPNEPRPQPPAPPRPWRRGSW